MHSTVFAHGPCSVTVVCEWPGWSGLSSLLLAVMLPFFHYSGGGMVTLWLMVVMSGCSTLIIHTLLKVFMIMVTECVPCIQIVKCMEMYAP